LVIYYTIQIKSLAFEMFGASKRLFPRVFQKMQRVGTCPQLVRRTINETKAITSRSHTVRAQTVVPIYVVLSLL